MATQTAVEVPGFGFAVPVKRDCPHIPQLDLSWVEEWGASDAAAALARPCAECGDASENWICLHTGKVLCSRYVNEHMLQWAEQTMALADDGIDKADGCRLPKCGCCAAISFSDLSVWCFRCNSYLEMPQLQPLLRKLQEAKFGGGDVAAAGGGGNRRLARLTGADAATNAAPARLPGVAAKLRPNEEAGGALDAAAVGRALASGDVQRVVVVAGAGISTNAGIPDFRSKGGLYDQVVASGVLPPEAAALGPTAVFNIEFFKSDPALYWGVAAGLLAPPTPPRPTLSHAFLRLLCNKGLVRRIFTQNIDGLELEAGVPAERVVFAHGNMASASCVRCARAHDPKGILAHWRETGEAPRCEAADCGGLVKHDVVFFGEDLPKGFYGAIERDVLAPARAAAAKATSEEQQAEAARLTAMAGAAPAPGEPGALAPGEEPDEPADLLLVMGTSLQVAPVSILPSLLPRGTSRVLMNRECVGDFGRAEDALLLADVDDTCRTVCAAAGWLEELTDIAKQIGVRGTPSSPAGAGGTDGDNSGA